MIVEAILGSAALQAVIVGSSGLLAGSAIGGLLVRRYQPRDPAGAPEACRIAQTMPGPSDRPDAPDGFNRPAESAPRVPDDPGAAGCSDRPSPGCARESGRTVRRSDASVPVADVRPQPGPASVHMSDATQVRELVGWMLHWEYFGTFSHVETLKFYHAWAREGRVVPLPDHTILRLLAEHPAVKRRRDRVKDPISGRVRKNAAGTPERETTYTFASVAMAAPGGVSAGDVVAGHRVKRAA